MYITSLSLHFTAYRLSQYNFIHITIYKMIYTYYYDTIWHYQVSRGTATLPCAIRRVRMHAAGIGMGTLIVDNL